MAEAPGEVVERRLIENAPEELHQRRQWVVRKGKVPYNAKTGTRASSTDSETWGTFDEAIRAFEGGGYDGFGFVFGSGDPYAGVDLDRCRDPETGELEAWAREILDDLDGYAEVSPSGTGVHVFVRGKAPNKKRGNVEAYSSERIFDGSALGLRWKWRERPDYRWRTIDRALRGVTETYALPERTRTAVGGNGRNREGSREIRESARGQFRRADLAAAIEDGVPPPEVLVPEVLLAGKVHSIFSAGGTGKTYMMLHLVREVVEAGKPVLIFDLENGLRIVAERLAQLDVTPQQARELVHYYPFPSMPLRGEAIEGFEQLLDELDPALVVFDSWVNCLAACGLDENSAVDIATWADAYAQKARMKDVAVLILDHVPKEGTGARGSSRKRDYVDVMWELRNPQKFDRRTVGRIDLHLRKDREGWLPPALTFGVGCGREGFVFRKDHRPIAPAEEAGLSSKERSTLKALEALGGTGASDGEWKAEAEKHRVAKPLTTTRAGAYWT